MTQDPTLCSVANACLGKIHKESPRVLSKNKEWSSSCLEIMLGFLSLLLYYSILFFFLWYIGTDLLYVTLQLVKVRMISWSFVQQTFQ